MAPQTLSAPVPTPSARRNGTLAAYGLGALATATGLGYALVDQLAVGGLDRHLHRLYDPVGKYGEAAPLYGYLYAVGVIGLLCWWANIRLALRGPRGTRRWGVITLVVALLPVAAPLVLQEYGQPVIPLQLVAGYLVAWVLGLVGVVLAGRATTPGAQRRRGRERRKVSGAAGARRPQRGHAIRTGTAACAAVSTGWPRRRHAGRAGCARSRPDADAA